MSFQHRLVTCPTGWLPATRFVEFYPGHGMEHERHYLLACNSKNCLDRQVEFANAVGIVVDPDGSPLTREVAELVTGRHLEVTS